MTPHSDHVHIAGAGVLLVKEVLRMPALPSCVDQAVKNLLPKIAITIFLGVLCNSSEALVPLLHQKLIDDVLVAKTASLGHVFGLYLALIVGTVALSYLFGRLLWAIGIAFERSLKDAYFKSMTLLAPARFSKTPAGDHISRLGNDITALSNDYLTPTMAIVMSASSAAVLVTVIAVGPGLAIAGVITVLTVLSVLTPRVYRARIAKASKNHLDSVAAYTNLVQDLFKGFVLISNATRVGFQHQNDRSTAKVAALRTTYSLRRVEADAISQTTMLLTAGLVLLVASWLHLSGHISLGYVVACISYCTSLNSYLEDILYSINTRNGMLAVKQQLDERLSPEPITPAPQSPATGADFTIVADPVTARCGRYHANVSLSSTTPGVFRVTGGSGTGKTTLFNILTGRIESTGALTANDDLVPLQHRAQFFCQSGQGDHVFSASFPDNVTVFGAYDYPANLIDHLTTQIPTFAELVQVADCGTLSGGEKQIVCFLRTCAIKAPITLLDEPFSAIDAKTSRVLRGILNDGYLPRVFYTSHESELLGLTVTAELPIETLCTMTVPTMTKPE